MIHATMLAVRAAQRFEKEAGISGGDAAAFFLGGALAGMGVKAYIDGNKRRDELLHRLNQLEHKAAVNNYTRPLDEQTNFLMDKQSALVNRVTDVSATTPPPKVPLPPTKSGLQMVQKASPIGTMSTTPAAGGNPGGGSTPAAPASTKTGSDDMSVPLVAAGLGGLGGWALGKHYVGPALDRQRAKVLAEIQEKQRRAAQLSKGSKLAPLGTAAAGALLLAALVSVMSRKKDAPAAPPQNGYPPPYYQDYDQSGGDFEPADQVGYRYGVY